MTTVAKQKSPAVWAWQAEVQAFNLQGRMRQAPHIDVVKPGPRIKPLWSPCRSRALPSEISGAGEGQNRVVSRLATGNRTKGLIVAQAPTSTCSPMAEIMISSQEWFVWFFDVCCSQSARFRQASNLEVHPHFLYPGWCCRWHFCGRAAGISSYLCCGVDHSCAPWETHMILANWWECTM